MLAAAVPDDTTIFTSACTFTSWPAGGSVRITRPAATVASGAVVADTTWKPAVRSAERASSSVRPDTSGTTAVVASGL